MDTTLALVRDLFFRSKIGAVANSVGATVAYAEDLQAAVECAAQSRPALILVDLSAFHPEETVLKLRAAAPASRLVGFASHVDVETLRRARAAGFALALARSEFSLRLGELLKS